MAIVKIGPPLAGIRGTIGGITYSENKAGPYAKLWAPSSNPRTPNQTIERGYLSQMPELWRDLTDGQRADWDTFAALGAQELTNSLGEAYYISGFLWFVKTNLRLARCGRAYNTTKPTQARPAAPTIDDFRICVAGTESDLCTCGVITASTEKVNYEKEKAFDNNLALTWLTSDGNLTGWIQYALCDAANIKRYRMYNGFTTSTWLPKNWTFQVHDGAAWQTIHTVTNWDRTPAGWHDFYCPNPYTKTDYRMNITLNHGSATNVGVTELEFYAADEGSSVICYPEDNFEDTPSYDLILHIAMGASIGQLVMYPGYYEILAKQSPGRWFETFQAELEAVFGTILQDRPWWARLHRQTTQGLRSTEAGERTVTIS